MTLDEMEKLARSHQDLDDPTDPWPAELVGQYARTLLAVLPVVRAAEAIKRGCDCEYDYRCGRCQSVVDVHDTIDHMRTVIK